MKGKKLNSCATKHCCNKMDIADIVMDVFHNSDLRVFFHEHKINSLK